MLGFAEMRIVVFWATNFGLPVEAWGWLSQDPSVVGPRRKGLTLSPFQARVRLAAATLWRATETTHSLIAERLTPPGSLISAPRSP